MKNSPLSYVDLSGHDAVDAENIPGGGKKIHIANVILPAEDFADWKSEEIGSERPRCDVMRELSRRIKEAREAISNWCSDFDEGRKARKYYLDHTSSLYHFLFGASKGDPDYQLQLKVVVQNEVEAWRDKAENGDAFDYGYMMEDVFMVGEVLIFIATIIAALSGAPMTGQQQSVAVTPNGQTMINDGASAAEGTATFDVTRYSMKKPS